MKKLITTLLTIATILVVSCADGDSDSSDTTTTTTNLSTLCLYYTYECGNTEEFVSSLGVTLSDGEVTVESVNKELYNYVYCIKHGTMILLDPDSGNKILVGKYNGKVILKALLADNSKVPPPMLCLYYTYKCGNNDEFVQSLGLKLKEGEVTVESVNKELYNYVYCINSGTMILLDPDSGHRGLVSKYKGKVILKAWLDDN